MIAEPDPDLAALQILSGRLATALVSIADDQWDRTTPCADWDLSALVDHVTGGNWFTVHILGGHSAEESMAHAINRFNATRATVELAASSVDDQLAAFRQPDVLDRTWNHLVGPLNGREILHLRLHDLIVHSWDIAEALDARAALPESLVRWGLQELSSDESTASTHFQLQTVARPDPIGDPETIEDAAATYLSRFGRSGQSGEGRSAVTGCLP